VASLPAVRTASVTLNYGPYGAKTFIVNALVDASAQDREALTRRIASVTLENYEDANQLTAVTVVLTSGFDIGIAQIWRSVNYVHTPQEWRVVAKS
jgi:hypothetical protein